MKRIFTLTLGLLIALVAVTQAKRDVVDQIAVIVEDQVILASEIASQMQMIALQTGQQPKTDAEAKAFQQRVINEMINDKLFQLEAAKDTSISIRPEEIEQALDDHIARISQNFPSEAAFEAALAGEGLTLRDLRRQFHDDVKGQLLKQRLIGRKLREVQVSRHEVEEFYQQYGDSIPTQPEGVKLAHILLTYNPSQEVEDSVRALATSLRQQVLDGADFSAISSRYSSMGAGANGGDLGYLSKDDVVPEFARAAFQLQPGEMSGVVRTEFGYHVILCTGQRESKLKLSHILLNVPPSAADTVQTLRLADSLIQRIAEGDDFAELAKTFSVDDDSRVQGGELGWFATENMPPEFADELTGWKTVGELKGPIQTRFGVHIVKLLDYQEAKKFTLVEDFDRIKEMARQHKTEGIVTKWIEEIKKHTYIENRMDT
jgi:peptidyl-prolyl cis-trans isomerase SurA